MTPYQPDVEAVGGSLFATAMVSTIPLLLVFVFLGLLKTKAHIAGLAALASAILVAIFAFGMPVDLPSCRQPPSHPATCRPPTKRSHRT